MAVPISNVNPLVDTFENWLEKTNEVSYVISTSAVTTAANSVGSVTQGNVFVEGIISSNVVAVAGSIRGGTVDTSSDLFVESDLYVNTSILSSTANVTFENSNTRILTANLTVSSGSLFITSNVNIKSNTIHVSTAGRLGVNTGTPDATLTVFGTANVAGRARFLDDVIVSGIIDVANTGYFSNVEMERLISDYATFNNDTSIFGDLFISGELSSSGLSVLSGGVLVDNGLTVTGTVGVTGSASISGSVSAASMTLGSPLPVSSGGTGLSSFFPGVLVASNTTHIKTVDGEEFDVMYYNGESWEAELLPSMAYQNSTSVSITGGSISGLSSLGVSGSVSVSGNVSISNRLSVTSAITTSSTITATGSISTSGNISAVNVTATGNVACRELLPTIELSVPRGGTGRTSLTSGYLLSGNNSGSVSLVAVGDPGSYLKSTGSVWAAANFGNDVRSNLTWDGTSQFPIGFFITGTYAGSQFGSPGFVFTPTQTVPLLNQLNDNLFPPNPNWGTMRYGSWRLISFIRGATVSSQNSEQGVDGMLWLMQRIS